MTTDLAVRRVWEYQSTVRGIYSESACFAHTLDAHLKHMADMVWEQPTYRKLPAWAKGRIQGYADAMWNSLYSTGIDYHSVDNRTLAPLMSVSIGPDGRVFGESDDTWLAESTDYKNAMVCSHVWRYRWNRGELKVWS